MTNNDDVLIAANDYAATDDVLLARYLRWNPITHCSDRAILQWSYATWIKSMVTEYVTTRLFEAQHINYIWAGQQPETRDEALTFIGKPDFDCDDGNSYDVKCSSKSITEYIDSRWCTPKKTHGADYLIVYTGVSYIKPTNENHGQIHIDTKFFGVYLVDTSTMMYKRLNFSSTTFSAYCPIHCFTY